MSHLEGRTARLYAQALFDLCEAGELESTQAALNSFSETWQDSDELRSALKNPAIPHEQRLAVVSDLAEQVAPGNEKVKNFLSLLLTNERLAGIREIAKMFSRFVAQLKQQLALQITTVAALPDSERSAIEERAASEFGSLVTVDWVVDNALLGGMILQIGDKVLDTSVSKSLARIQEQLMV